NYLQKPDEECGIDGQPFTKTQMERPDLSRVSITGSIEASLTNHRNWHCNNQQINDNVSGRADGQHINLSVRAFCQRCRVEFPIDDATLKDGPKEKGNAPGDHHSYHDPARNAECADVTEDPSTEEQNTQFDYAKGNFFGRLEAKFVLYQFQGYICLQKQVHPSCILSQLGILFLLR
ncbi:MAG: hypothetical protein Q9181_005190, partial [Wetmoreana brouardii]